MVEWPHFHFLKIGVTTGHRWQTFVGRGGELRYLGPPSDGAGTQEAEMHAVLRNVGWPRAFACKEASIPFLGCGGAGWTEVYRLGEPGAHRVAIDELAARRRGA